MIPKLPAMSSTSSTPLSSGACSSWLPRAAILAFLRNIVEEYLESAASQLIELRAATERRDSATAKAALHGLKGASATMGATGVAAACAALEKAFGRGDMADMKELPGLAAELARAAPALRERAAVDGPDVAHIGDGLGRRTAPIDA